MREAFALQKLLTFFHQKYWHIWDINVWNFNVSLTNDVVSFEQPGPGCYHYYYHYKILIMQWSYGVTVCTYFIYLQEKGEFYLQGLLINNNNNNKKQYVNWK